MLFWSTREHVMKENRLIRETKSKKKENIFDSNVKVYSG